MSNKNIYCACKVYILYFFSLLIQVKYYFPKMSLILNKFHCKNDIYTFIDDLRSNNYNFVKVTTIGHTVHGTPLKIIKIKSDNNSSDIIWIDGGIHLKIFHNNRHVSQ